MTSEEWAKVLKDEEDKLQNGDKQSIFDEFIDVAEEGLNLAVDYPSLIASAENILSKHKGKSNELYAYRENVPVLLNAILCLTKKVHALNFLLTFENLPYSNANKRWSNEDDDSLIEMMCKDMPIKDVSSILRRSPSAILTRLSHLVGVKRVSQQVAGKFIGMANGEEFKANLVGTIYKE